MKEHIIFQMLYGLILMASFIFLSDALSLKGKKLDFYERGDTYVILHSTIPELSRFTVCMDLLFTDDHLSDWIAFSYITNNTFLGREDIDLGLAGDHHRLILYNLGKIFYIHYHLTPLQWHTVCLMRDGVKGKLELFLNKERLLVTMDQPQNLTPNGTVVLGHFPKNGHSQVKSIVRSFTGSLYYFQLWDHILENEEFMKCLEGNVVSWEEDAWLINKIIPTVDKRLRCFVSDNITIQGTSTTVSQQIDLTTPSQITGLKPQKTLYSSTVMSKSIPVFATNYTTISYSNTTSPPLETTTASKNFKPSVAEISTLAADTLLTSAAITLPTKSISIITNNNSMKTSNSPSSERTMTTKMAEAITSEAFHQTTATDFLYTSGFTNNSVVSKTSATRSQSAITKTTSLFSSVESTSMTTTSWPKHRSTDIGALPISTTGQVFLAFSTAGTVPWSTVEQTSATSTTIGTALAFPPEPELISTAAPVDSVFPRNQTASTSARADMEIAFTVHSMTLPARPIETTLALKTAETELTSTNFQDVSSPRVEDAISTSMPKEASSMALSFRASSPFIGVQSVQTVIDDETTLTVLTPGITLEPTVAETSLSPPITGPVYTQNMPTAGENMFLLSSTRSTSTAKVSGSGPTTITDEAAHLFSTNETARTPRRDQNLLTSVNTSTILTLMPKENFLSAFHGGTSNIEHSSTTTNIITPPEASTGSEATTAADATITATARYTTALSKLMSLWFTNFSTVSGTTSVPKSSELLLKTTPMSTVAANELLSTPRETVVPPEDTTSTLADVKSNFSTEESPSETTQTETNVTIAFGETTDLVPKSVATQISNATVTRKETTSHYLKGKSTTAVTSEVSPFSTMLEVTDESAQMVTALTTISPFPNIEKTSTLVDNKNTTTEVRSWFTTKSVKTTPKSLSSYNATTEIFNSTHTYTAGWTSESLREGNSVPSPTSGLAWTLPELLDVSTTRILGTIFTTTPTDRTAMSLSAGMLPPQPISTHSPATPGPVTHMFSLPVNGSAVTSMMVSNETKVTMPEPSTPARTFSTSMLSDVSTLPSATVTTASMTTLSQTASTTSNNMPTHRDSILTTSEGTVISVKMTPMTFPSLTETPVPSLRPPTPMTTKVDTTLHSTSSDTVTPSTHTLTYSTSLPNNIPVVSSTHVISTASTPVATQSASQVAEATVLERSTHALSFLHSLSGGTDALSLVTGTTETSVVDETMPSHTSANKFTTSIDIHNSQSSTRLVNTPVPTLLMIGTSTVSSDKEQAITSLGNTPKTMDTIEMSPSKNYFISYSQGTSSLKMTDMGFSETLKISSHQTYSPSEIPLGTLPEGNSASSSTSGSTQTTATLTSNNTVDAHISEMSTRLGKTDLPPQALTTTTFLSLEKESMSAPSVYTPRSVEMILSPTSVTRLVSFHQDTSFIDTATPRTTRLLNFMNINTTTSHLPSLRTQTEVTSVSSPISESTQASPESLSLFTTELFNASFPIISTDRITTALSVPNVPTSLLGKTSMATRIPISQMSSLPINVTAFTSKRIPETPTILMTQSSETTSPGCWKSSVAATSGPMSEIVLLPVNDSAFSPVVVSSGTSTTAGPFPTLSASITPRTAMTIETSTLDVIPVTYAGPSAKGTVVSPAFATSEMTKMSSSITPTTFFSLEESTFPSVKTIPTTVKAGIVTPLIGTTVFSLLSSKNTEAVSSTPTITFSPILSTAQQPSQGDEATTLSLLPGITHSSLTTVSSGTETALTNTYSRTVVPENVPSLTPSGNLHTSLNIQVSPSLTSFTGIPGPTKSVKVTTYLSSNTGKMTSLSENTPLTDELTKSATSINTPISYPPLTPFIATPLSLTSFLYSPHSIETEFSTTKTSTVSTTHMTEFPILGTAITSSNSESFLKTSWSTLTATDSQFPVSTTAHVPTPNNMETATLQLVPGSLSIFIAPQTGLVSEDTASKPSIPMSGILSTFGLFESPSLSASSRAIPTTLADIKQTFEKTSTSVTPGITLPSKPSSAAAGSTISKAATLPTLIWISSSFPSVSPLATVSKAPQVITSTVEEPKSTFLTSDTTPAHPFTNFTTLPFATVGTILTNPMPTPTGFPASLPVSVKITDDNAYISTSPRAFPRITVMANSRTVSLLPSFSRMSMSPLTTDHTLSVGSIPLSSPTVTSSWSSIPAVSVSPTLVLPKPTLDSLPNITTTTSPTNRASFPLISTGVTHPSTATGSSLISSSFETTGLNSTPSFLSTETLTSTIAAEYTVSFYNIEMIFSVFDGEPRTPITSVINEFAEYWLNFIFQDSEFTLANLATQIKSRDMSEEEVTMDRAFVSKREGQGMATISHVPYSCVCQVIIKANSSLAPTELINKIKSKIHGNLTYTNFTQDQLTLLVKSEHVAVKKLEPGRCKADETASKFKGTYKWLLTNPTETAQTRCIKNEDGNATRICSISINTGKSQWEQPKYKQCKLLQELPNKIVDLANITINDENADDVAEHILNLIHESPHLDKEETKIVVSKVSDISQCDGISVNLTQIILQIIDAVLGKQNDSASDVHEVSNEILRIIDRAGHKMEFFGNTANLTVARLALAVLRVDHRFEGMAFSIRSFEEGIDPEIYLSEVPLGKILASIYLPKSLRERIPLNNLQTVLFNFFGQTSLFKIKNFTKALTTYVVSASISDMSIQNLADPVVITLHHIEGSSSYGQVHCAFWDFGKNGGLGGWNSSGCTVNETNVNYTICQCDHLTHFGVLMDLSRATVDAVNERILVLITYTGCGISSIFLGIAIVTYLVFHKLRKDYPSKILINLCTALLMLNMVFLVNSWSASFQKVGLCITTAVALHYFLLVSLTWMGLEAVHMYFALVKVFNIYIPNYILKFCLVGWGIPAIMVTIILSVKKDLYGTLSSGTPFCWIKDDSVFYISVVGYFCLIFIMNLSMFCTVIVQLNSMKAQSQKTRRKMILHDLKGTTSLTFLLGLTWGFAFFAWGPVRIFFLYLFAIFNTLQGFLIFVFHCAMKENVREQWQIHLCCKWFRLDNSPDVSSRYGLNVGSKQKRLRKTFEHKLLTPSIKSTATNSTFKSVSSAQGTPSGISFPNDHFDENPFGFFPLSCEVEPNCGTRGKSGKAPDRDSNSDCFVRSPKGDSDHL
ncbi:adhesion G-protein coupled receptor G4 [Elephas maximus indicus]|uniref:adhesion G-protein coupled receptor G4 n=1 Tax=Elephas maximus indicus TaxID=99487 RepID=UPI00211655A5|nr:adhesion G-protein coupled receptor G4 [Elephas maximus indicus]